MVKATMADARADLRYPIGEFTLPNEVTKAQREAWLEEVARLPERVRAALAGLSETQLDTPYRPGGWSVRQVAHHLPDSHLNSYTRFKLALTEANPTIRPYDEAGWAELGDSDAPIEVSLALLDALHKRWGTLLNSLSESDWQRTFTHPASNQTLTLEQSLANYAWHGEHHLAHITSLRQREGWE